VALGSVRRADGGRGSLAADGYVHGGWHMGGAAYVIVCQGFFVMILIVSASRMTSNHAMKKHVTSLVLYVNSVACLTYIYKLTYGVPQVSKPPSSTPC